MLLLEQFEHLTLHPKNTAKLKELVLQLAVQGKLTENWRKQNPAVEPASELLKRIEAEKAKLVKEKKIKKEKPLEPVSEDEVPFILPEDWAWLRLSELTYTFGQKTPDTSFSYIDVASVDNKKGVIGDDLQIIPPNEAPSRARKIVKEGCVIYSTVRPYLLNIAIVENNYQPEAIASTAFAVLNPVPSLDKKFLYCYLRSAPFIEYVESQMIGVAYPAINDAKLLYGVVPLPPLAEQEAIVARVEELMHKIEELEQQTEWRLEQKKNLGIAALQKLTAAADEDLPQHWHFLQQHFQTIFNEPANVKKLRETILQLAVQGKLTTTWRKQNPTTEPASELLKRIQEEKAKLVKEKKIKKEKPLESVSEEEVPYALPEGWVWCRLGELSNTFLGGYSYKSPLFISEGNNQVLRLGNVKNDMLLLDSAPVFIDEKLAEDSVAFELLPEDILVTMTGTRAKRDYCFTILVDKSYFKNRRLFLNQRVGCFRLNNYNNKKYIIKSLKVSNLLDPIFDSATGTANQANIGKVALVNMLIPLPPLAEQEAIVAKVDQLMQLCDELVQQLQQSKKEAEALMQAVVQEALQVQEEVAL